MSSHPTVRSVTIRGFRGTVSLLVDRRARGVNATVNADSYGYWDQEPGELHIYPRSTGRPVGVMSGTQIDEQAIAAGVIAFSADPDFLHDMDRPKVGPDTLSILTDATFDGLIEISAGPGVTVHFINSVCTIVADGTSQGVEGEATVTT